MSHGIDFTLQGYAELLRTARSAGYRFTLFADPARHEPGPACLLRHDVDASPAAALRLARLEAEHGVRATYFFMLRSPVYNLLSRESDAAVRAVLELGHELGLHYDGAGPRVRGGLAESAAAEAETLGGLFGATVRAVSFHQPDMGTVAQALRGTGLVNTYDPRDMGDYVYVSDSNKVWRDAPARDILAGRAHEKVQLLLHPMWWATEEQGQTTEAGWDAALLGAFETAQAQLLATERAYGPRRALRLELKPG